jgi:hypothetical protein
VLLVLNGGGTKYSILLYSFLITFIAIFSKKRNSKALDLKSKSEIKVQKQSASRKQNSMTKCYAG